MSETYLNNWSSREEMAQDFDLTGSELDGANVLLASYGTPAYEGYAFVIFERSGKLNMAPLATTTATRSPQS
jgi:hypothetical protein